MLKIFGQARSVLRPQVVLPLLLAAALLLFAFNLGNLGKVMARLREMPLHVLAISLAAAVVYLGCKSLQLRLMLQRVGVQIPSRSFWLAFAVGELTVTLPLGVFAQNWILSASRRVHIGRSAAATVMMLLVEIAAVFLFLAIVPIPGWGEVRWIAVALLALFTAMMTCALLFEEKLRTRLQQIRRQGLIQVAQVASELLDSLRKLCTPSTIAVSLVLAAIYLGALGTAFWQVGRGMHVQHLSFLDATTIYIFSLAVILIGAGLITQIGTLDLMGMVIARAWGIDYTDGLAMMLGFRIVWTGSMWLLCLPFVGTTWREIPTGRQRREQASGDGGEKVCD